MITRIIHTVPALQIIVSLILCLFLFQTTALATQPDTTTAPAGKGWVEIQATVPDGFQKDISIVLQAADGTPRTIYVLARNGYIGRAEMEYGTYDVMSAGVVNDNKMEYPSDWSPYVIDIQDSEAAELITVTVTSSADSYNPIIPIPQGSTTTTPDIDDTSSAPEDDTTEFVDPSEPVTEAPEEEIEDTDASDTTVEEDPSEEESPGKAGQIVSVIKYIFTVAFGIAVFVGIVFGIVYIVRRRNS